VYNLFCYHNFQRNSVKHWTFVDGNLTRIWAMVNVLRRTIGRADLRESAGTRHNAAETAWEIIFVMENRPCLYWRTIWCDLWPHCDRTGRSLNVYRWPFFPLNPKHFDGKLLVTFTVNASNQTDTQMWAPFVEKERIKIQSNRTKSVKLLPILFTLY